MELSFRETSKELNELHLTFNRVARTINLATQSLQSQVTDEQQAQALLSYADAFHIYSEFDEHHSQKGVCLANIGAIMMQKGDYRKSRLYYSDAIGNLVINMEGDSDDEQKALSVV